MWKITGKLTKMSEKYSQKIREKYSQLISEKDSQKNKWEILTLDWKADFRGSRATLRVFRSTTVIPTWEPALNV